MRNTLLICLLSVALLGGCAAPPPIPPTPTFDPRSHDVPRTVHLVVVRSPGEVFVLPQWWYSSFVDNYGALLIAAVPTVALASLPMAFGTDVSDDRRLREVEGQRYMWAGGMDNETLEQRLQSVPGELSTGKNWRIVGTTFRDDAVGLDEFVNELHSGPSTNTVVVLSFFHYVTPNLEHLRVDVHQAVYAKTYSGRAFGAGLRSQRRFSYVSPARSVEFHSLTASERAEIRSRAEARFETLIAQNPEESRRLGRLLKLKLNDLEDRETTPVHVVLNQTWSAGALDPLIVQSVDHVVNLIRREWSETSATPSGLSYDEKYRGVDSLNRPYVEEFAELAKQDKNTLLRTLSGNYLSVPSLDIQESRVAPRSDEE